MNQVDKILLYKRAIQQWGSNAQMDMVIEECAELIQAINKFRRNPTPDSMKNLCGEIADVEIMIEQTRLVILKDGLILQIKEQKLRRLEDRLNKK